jgi:hypothetical protein
MTRTEAGVINRQRMPVSIDPFGTQGMQLSTDRTRTAHA